MYEMNKSNPGELNRYWFSLLGKDLYRTLWDNIWAEYRAKTDALHERLYSLTGTFIKDEGAEQFSKKTTLHCFSLFFSQQSMKLYTIKSEEKDGWVRALKEAIGYSNLYDYYTIGVLPSEYRFRRKRWARASSGWCATPSTLAPVGGRP